MTDSAELEAIGYADAMTELETILYDLEGDDLDVDVLAGRVERASQLIDVCRRRITNARIQVEQVVATLEAGTLEADSHNAELDDESLLDPPES